MTSRDLSKKHDDVRLQEHSEIWGSILKWLAIEIEFVGYKFRSRTDFIVLLIQSYVGF